MLYNHSSGGNGTCGDGGGAWCSIRAQQRARASGPCCPLSSCLSGFQAASGCSQGDPGLGHAGAQLPHGSQQDRGTGPLLSWRAWGRAQTLGSQAPSQRIWVSLGPRAVALLTITSVGGRGPKEGGGGWGQWVPTEMDLLGRGCSSGALLVGSAPGLQGAAAEPGTLGPQTSRRGAR